jgi:hypothetical protein
LATTIDLSHDFMNRIADNTSDGTITIKNYKSGLSFDQYGNLPGNSVNSCTGNAKKTVDVTGTGNSYVTIVLTPTSFMTSSGSLVTCTLYNDHKEYQISGTKNPSGFYVATVDVVIQKITFSALPNKNDVLNILITLTASGERI